MADEDYDKAIKYCAPIAKPLASQKLCKKVLKLCKKATKTKQVKRGVKEVVKAIRKNNKGCEACQSGAAVPVSCAPMYVFWSCATVQDCDSSWGHLANRRHYTRSSALRR